MLSMRNIRKIYRTDLIETHALDGVSVDVAAGEFVAVMGRSGSGKTTFLNVAGLLDTFDEGTYHLDGQDVSRLSDAEMSRIRNEKIGFIFQSFNLIPDLDVFDNVDVPLRYRRLRPQLRRRPPSPLPREARHWPVPPPPRLTLRLPSYMPRLPACRGLHR